MSDLRFNKKFFKILGEASVADLEPTGNEQEDLGVDPNAEVGFDDVPDNPVAVARGQEVADTVGQLQQWISEVERFVNYLNGVEPGSVNYKLNNVDCDSILADVGRSETKKISRIAQDLSGFGESLKQYLLSAQQKQASASQV